MKPMCAWGVALLSCLLAGLGARAETIPVRGQVDARVRTAAYNPDQVYKLYGFVGYAVELIFEDGERFAETGGGDLEGVTVDAHGSSVLLKPRAAIVSTNLVVFTDRRAPSPRSAAKDFAEEIERIVEPTASGCSYALRKSRMSVTVIGRPFLFIRENFVSLSQLLETLLGFLIARVFVGMVLHRELPVCLLDIRLGGIPVYSKHLIIVAFLGHVVASISE